MKMTVIWNKQIQKLKNVSAGNKMIADVVF